jgi:hypothetical protein
MRDAEIILGYHETIARMEVLPEDIPLLLQPDLREKIIARFEE